MRDGKVKNYSQISNLNNSRGSIKMVLRQVKKINLEHVEFKMPLGLSCGKS